MTILVIVIVHFDLVWQNQVEKALIPLHILPFLPVNPAFSATRNQGRQKLARYGPKEFLTFIYDILNEVRRRYHGIVPQSPVNNSSKCKNLKMKRFFIVFSSYFQVHTLPRQTNANHLVNANSSISSQDILQTNGPLATAALINAFIDSDDEPLYDKVASDEDYSSLPNNEQQKRQKIPKKTKHKVKTKTRSNKTTKFSFFVRSYRWSIRLKINPLTVY